MILDTINRSMINGDLPGFHIEGWAAGVRDFNVAPRLHGYWDIGNVSFMTMTKWG